MSEAFKTEYGYGTNIWKKENDKNTNKTQIINKRKFYKYKIYLYNSILIILILFDYMRKDSEV